MNAKKTSTFCARFLLCHFLNTHNDSIPLFFLIFSSMDHCDKPGGEFLHTSRGRLRSKERIMLKLNPVIWRLGYLHYLHIWVSDDIHLIRISLKCYELRTRIEADFFGSDWYFRDGSVRLYFPYRCIDTCNTERFNGFFLFRNSGNWHTLWLIPDQREEILSLLVHMCKALYLISL